MNRLKAGWTNAIHNIPKYYEGRKASVGTTVARIIHDRTVQSMEQREARSDLRENHISKVLPERIKADPKDTRSIFYLAQQHHDARRWDASFYWHERYTRTQSPNKWPEEEYIAATRACQAARILDDPTNLERMALKAIGILPNRAEAYFHLGEIAYNKMDNEVAYRFLKLAASCPVPINSQLWHRAEVHSGGWLVSDLLAQTCWRLGYYQEGYDILMEMLAKDGVPADVMSRNTDNLNYYREKLGIEDVSKES